MEKSQWKNTELEKFFQENIFTSPMDYMVQDCLLSLAMREEFFAYPKRVDSECPDYLPELKDTKGLLIFREDWIKIFSRTAGVSILDAHQTLRAVHKNENAPEVSTFEKIENAEIRNLLLARSKQYYSKAHAVNGWLQYKQTAILKSLWPKEYLAALDAWEKEHGLVWFEFGYKPSPTEFYLKA